MIISKTGAEQSHILPGGSGTEKSSGKKLSSEGLAAVSKDVSHLKKPVENDVLLRDDSLLTKQGLNSFAEGIRSKKDSLVRINDFMATMKERLGTIVKNYPPFPPHSPERMNLLKSFTALRKEIERMTFPPEHKYLPDLPAITPASGNDQLEKAIKAIDEASAAVDDGLERLNSEMHSVASSLGQDMTEDKAIELSIEMRNSLSGELSFLSGEGRTETLRQILD